LIRELEFIQIGVEGGLHLGGIGSFAFGVGDLREKIVHVIHAIRLRNLLLLRQNRRGGCVGRKE